MDTPTRQESIVDVAKHGCDAQHLYLIKYEELNILYDQGRVDEDIFAHWDNCQEELRCMIADLAAEFG